MTRIVDTAPTFAECAAAAALEAPFVRERMWRERYENAHPDVFDAFYAGVSSRRRPVAQVRELRRVRENARAGAAAMEALIADVEPAVRAALGVAETPAPVHVLLVGTGSVNASVGRLGEDVAVFHCLEWFKSADDWRVLAAHETAHALHEIRLGARPPEDDLAWTAFSEGLAVLASQRAVPDRSDQDYYWYGHPGFRGWMEWCREHRDQLRAHLRDHLDDFSIAETLFGAEKHQGHLRTGYFTATDLLASTGRPLAELVALDVDGAREVVRAALR